MVHFVYFHCLSGSVIRLSVKWLKYVLKFLIFAGKPKNAKFERSAEILSVFPKNGVKIRAVL